MLNIHQRYCTETFDARGNIKSFRVTVPDDFNFAYDVMDEIGAAEPEKMAMLWRNPEGEEHDLRFSDITRLSNKAANAFLSLGIKKGDKVMVIVRRHYSFWIMSLALTKIGAVVIPATFLLKEHDVAYRVDAAGVAAIVATTAGDIAGIIDGALEQTESHPLRLLINAGQPDIASAAGTVFDPALSGPALSGEQGLFAAPCSREGWIDFTTRIHDASDELERVPNSASDPFLIYFTSGTSGEPKMALHTHDYAAAHLTTAKWWHGINPEGVHMTVADTGWAKCTWGKFYGQWFMEGCQLVYDFDRFNAKEILGLIEKYRLTTFCCPPTMWRMLSHEDVDAFDLSSIERFTTAGEALPPDQFDFWFEHTGHKIYEGFGQSEGPVIVANMIGTEPRAGSMGRPVPFGTVRLLRPDLTECRPGEEGEICIKCDPKPAGIIREYYREPEKTAEVFEGGWYHTGDVAYADEDGYYYYCGRDDDLIKSSGYRISPFEVESALNRHPQVRECAVTGVPDELRGFAVKATVVLEPGVEASDELIRDLQTWTKRQTAPYKYPRIIDFVDELPRTFSGKIRRVQIRTHDLKELAQKQAAHTSYSASEDGKATGAVTTTSAPVAPHKEEE